MRAPGVAFARQRLVARFADPEIRQEEILYARRLSLIRAGAAPAEDAELRLVFRDLAGHRQIVRKKLVIVVDEDQHAVLGGLEPGDARMDQSRPHFAHQRYAAPGKPLEPRLVERRLRAIVDNDQFIIGGREVLLGQRAKAALQRDLVWIVGTQYDAELTPSHSGSCPRFTLSAPHLHHNVVIFVNCRAKQTYPSEKFCYRPASLKIASPHFSCPDGS
jgi:hypothetical protein